MSNELNFKVHLSGDPYSPSIESQLIARLNSLTATLNGLSAEITAAKAEIDEIVDRSSDVFHYRGSVPTYSSLPNGASIGDTYNVEDSHVNYCWSGTKWDDLGGIGGIPDLGDGKLIIWR